MSAAFIISTWAGKVRVAVDHLERRSAPSLDVEVARVPISDTLARMPLAFLETKFAPAIRETQERAL